MSRTTTICVIGAGPRGLSVLERLSANAAAAEQQVVLHVVDPYLGLGGRVWRTTQPTHLLMNTVASQVTMYTDPSVNCEGPIRPGPSLYEWAKFVTLMEPVESESYPAWVRAEAAALGPDSYPSRAFYGHYLNWVLDRLLCTAPEQVSMVLHHHSAVALDEDEDGSQIVTLDNGARLLLDRVVLAQGHIEMPLSDRERSLRDHADSHGLDYFPPASPAEVDLDAIAPGRPVALRGLGLNFFDYMTLLTEGRGGTYVRENGRLSYRPSGKEPMMFAGSRRGIPYHARGENQKGAHGRHGPGAFTPETIASLRDRRRAGERIEFRKHIWPLVDREVTGVYYHALIAERLCDDEAGAFLREYTGTPLGTPADDRLLTRFGIEPSERWDWDLIARPYRDHRFTTPGRFQDWLLDYLRRDLAEARRGNVDGPLKAALDVMRDLRNEIRLVVDHAGITGESYRDELQSWYTPLNAFVSIGPPPSRIEELIALIDAGVLRMIGPGMRVVPTPGGAFTVSSADIPGSETEVTALIEARLPEVDVRTTTDRLIQGLMVRGACRPYLLPTGTDGHVEVGGLTVTRRPYRLVDAAGQAHRYRFAFGVPTETVHWATAAGIRPGVDSVILGDADAIARACLATGTAERPAVTERAQAAL
ncbi:FAD/NAD(P)-binding protein [Streptomyces netropsis]|uniref:FAD/NAD(P)-binding protein n=1 Tax=Streptomyces netropsis TaxID=55404 RepID=UPI0037A0379D